MRRFYRTALTTASRAWHRAICIGLVLTLLTTSTPAAPQIIVATGQEWRLSVGFWFRSSGLPKWIQGGNQSRTQETQTQREAKIARVEIFPKNATVELESRIRFTAVAYDLDGNTIGGIKFKWQAANVTTGKRAPISGDGEFRAKIAGSFTISAEAKGNNAEVPVVVSPALSAIRILRLLSHVKYQRATSHPHKRTLRQKLGLWKPLLRTNGRSAKSQQSVRTQPGKPQRPSHRRCCRVTVGATRITGRLTIPVIVLAIHRALRLMVERAAVTFNLTLRSTARLDAE